MIYVSSFPPTLIRRATTDDLEEIFLLETICFRERRFKKDHILWVLHHPYGVTFIDTEKKTRGTLMLLIESDVCRILSIAVHPAHRHKSVGTALMREAEHYAISKGSKKVRLEVGVNNVGALEFYNKLGYKNTGTLTRYYSWGEDAYTMSKKLSDCAKT